MRQVDVPALSQPHERHHPRGARHRLDPAGRTGHSRRAPGRGAAARAHRHGVPEAEPVSQVHLRERGLRSAIARAIAVQPEVILMDEPCSALDPIATARIEDLIDELRESYAIVVVTHSMQQAARVSQRTAYFHLGELIEVGATDRVFTNPRHRLTEDYITGRFG